MQILPNIFSGLFSKVSDGGNDVSAAVSGDSSFANIFDAECSNCKAGAVAVSKNGKNGVMPDKGDSKAGNFKDLLSDVKVTKKDLVALKEKLKSVGMSDKDIEALLDKLESEGGITWNSFLELVADKLGVKDKDALMSTDGDGPTKLLGLLNKAAAKNDLPEPTDQERGQLVGFFQKFGFTTKEAEGMVKDLGRGDFDKVTRALSAKLNSADKDSTLVVFASELKVLAKAAGLPASVGNKIDALFGGRSHAELNQDEIKTTLNLLVGEAAEQAKGLLKNASELHKSLASIIKKAIERHETETKADKRDSKETEAAKVQIEKAAKEKDGESGDKKTALDRSAEAKEKAHAKFEDGEIAEKAKNEAGGAANEKNKAGLGTGKDGVALKTAESDGQKAKVRFLDINAETKTDAEEILEKIGKHETVLPDESLKNDGNRLVKHAKTEAEQAQVDLKNLATGKGDAKDADLFSGNDKDGSAGKDKGWDALWSKVEVSGSDNISKTIEAGFANKLTELGSTTAQTKAESAMNAANRSLSEHVLKQVENGILKNLNNGGHRLTLRLDPPELGKVAVILQVQNKDVRAVIRTQDENVSRMISEQMGQLKVALEQQGLKVDKIDVQTNTQQENSARDWAGTEQHNMAREQHEFARSAMSNRLLRRQAESGEQLAREMQPQEGSVNNSQSGLYIIA